MMNEVTQSTSHGGNLLVKDYLYSQTFAYKQDTKDEFEKSLENYINYMLNELGLFFYKASTFEAERVTDSFPSLNNQSFQVCKVDFYMYTYDHLVESKGQREAIESPEHVQKFFGNLVEGFKTTIHFEGKTHLRKPEFHSIDLPEGSYHGDIEGLNWGVIKTFVFYWLIVPRIQSDFFDIIYQMYAFDLAHQGWIPKFAHFFTIPGNVVFTLAFLCQFKIGSLDMSFGPFEMNNAAFVVAIALSLLYIVNGYRYKLNAWGCSTAFVIMILLAVAQLFYFTFKVEGNPWYCSTTTYANPLVWIYVSSMIESLSHLIVPQLPPYVTGVNYWQGTIDFFLNGRAFFLLISFFNGVFLAPAVSYMSWPHLIGNMVLCQLFGIGYHAKFYEGYQKMVQKACLTGNPSMDKVPESFNELIHGAPGNSGNKSEGQQVYNVLLDTIRVFYKQFANGELNLF